jgi:hypothetical protein
MPRSEQYLSISVSCGSISLFRILVNMLVPVRYLHVPTRQTLAMTEARQSLDRVSLGRSHLFMLLMPRPLPRWRTGCSCRSVGRSVRKRHAACRPTWFHPILPPRVMRLGFSRHVSIIVLVNLVCTTLEAQAVLDRTVEMDHQLEAAPNLPMRPDYSAAHPAPLYWPLQTRQQR